MAKRYVDVYKAAKEPDEYQIGVRDDFDATVWGAERTLDDWRRAAPRLYWTSANAALFRACCGELMGRIEYDDESEACAPSP